MTQRRLLTSVVLLVLCPLNASRLWAQGPPYQTDDPVPVELHHYEFYIFGSLDGTTAEIDSTGPAIEFNWGAISRLQLHAILPMGVVAPSNNPIYAPGGIGRTFFGLTDMELGQDRHRQGTKHIPQIGTFTMLSPPEVTQKGSGLGKSGTNSRSGCKRTSGGQSAKRSRSRSKPISFAVA